MVESEQTDDSKNHVHRYVEKMCTQYSVGLASPVYLPSQIIEFICFSVCAQGSIGGPRIKVNKRVDKMSEGLGYSEGPQDQASQVICFHMMTGLGLGGCEGSPKGFLQTCS